MITVSGKIPVIQYVFNRLKSSLLVAHLRKQGGIKIEINNAIIFSADANLLNLIKKDLLLLD